MEDHDDIRRRVGDNLAVAFGAVGKTQADIVRQYGVDKTKLSHWVRGKHLPDIEFVLAFCKDHSITTDWIYQRQAWGVPGEVGASLRRAAEESSGPR